MVSHDSDSDGPGLQLASHGPGEDQANTVATNGPAIFPRPAAREARQTPPAGP